MQAIAQRCSCPVCKETAQHDVYNVREMMFGLGDEFTYLQCNNCGCLYLKTKVEDLSEYYPKGYYSHKMDTLRKRNFLSLVLKRQRAKYAMSDSGWLGRMIERVTGIPQYLLWIRKVGVSLHDAILDVGSGGGKLLLSMREDGFRNLMGVDPFIEEDVEYGGGVRICKKALSEIQGSFDFIMLNHSFEHMTEPHRALKEVYRLLRPRKFAMIRTPVVPCYAFRKYKEYWVQIDAPRHQFIFSKKAMEMLAEDAEFQLHDVLYDSYEIQFWGSEQYMRGIPLMDKRSYRINPKASMFTNEKIREFKRRGGELNEKQDGDQACFFLFKPG